VTGPIINGYNQGPDGRFGVGNRGRPVGSKQKLATAFTEALQDDFMQHGVAAIQRVREEKPAEYLRIIESIIPKETQMTLTDERPFAHMSDDELHAEVVKAIVEFQVSADESIGEKSGKSRPQRRNKALITGFSATYLVWGLPSNICLPEKQVIIVRTETTEEKRAPETGDGNIMRLEIDPGVFRSELVNEVRTAAAVRIATSTARPSHSGS